MQLPPVTYLWRAERMNKKGRKEIGFTAQNVEKVLPDLVGEAHQAPGARIKLPSNKAKALSYERLVAPAILAIQQQQAEIEALKAVNDHPRADDEKQLAALKADNDNLRAEFEAYKKAHP